MVSIKALVMALMLVALCLQAKNTSAAAAQRKCCRKYSTVRIAADKIKGYSLQTVIEMCPIDAVIFLTKKGKIVCSNPAWSWVMHNVNLLRSKVQQVHLNPSKA